MQELLETLVALFPSMDWAIYCIDWAIYTVDMENKRDVEFIRGINYEYTVHINIYSTEEGLYIVHLFMRSSNQESLSFVDERKYIKDNTVLEYIATILA